MRFIVYSPTLPSEPPPPPTPELMVEMGKLVEEGLKNGVLVTTGGLSPTGTRLRLQDGKFTVTDGPFIELKELMAGFAVIETQSLEEALVWCKKFRSIVGDGESEIVQIHGPH